MISNKATTILFLGTPPDHPQFSLFVNVFLILIQDDNKPSSWVKIHFSLFEN